MKKLLSLLILIPTIACGQSNIQRTSDINNIPKNISSNINIVSITDNGYQDKISTTQIVFVYNGKVYNIIQDGKSCYFKPGNTLIQDNNGIKSIVKNSNCS